VCSRVQLPLASELSISRVSRLCGDARSDLTVHCAVSGHSISMDANWKPIGSLINPYEAAYKIEMCEKCVCDETPAPRAGGRAAATAQAAGGRGARGRGRAAAAARAGSDVRHTRIRFANVMWCRAACATVTKLSSDESTLTGEIAAPLQQAARPRTVGLL
jgi:hypothetical protein